MAVATASVGAVGEGLWLRSKRWDLTFITLSVVLVAVPYAAYLFLLNFGLLVEPISEALGASTESISRNLVNGSVALLVGGPHMYATWTRTYADHDFTKTHHKYMISSMIIPAIVIALAFFNLQLLLTIFFFWASIHVLHQIIYITELYDKKDRVKFDLFSKVTDYAVVLTALYPLAAWKIATGRFAIGPNNLSDVVGSIIPLGNWMIWLAGGAFAISLIAWLTKSGIEYSQGRLNGPKTLFIGLTVTASFFVPALGNLDTAFQGMNVWHSFQYLALTWMLNNLRQHRGELKDSKLVNRLSKDGSARRYYTFNIGLTIADVLLAVVLFGVMYFAFNLPFDYAFDRAYYIAVLSFLWIHYYFDHYLFSQPQVINPSPVPAQSA